MKSVLLALVICIAPIPLPVAAQDPPQLGDPVQLPPGFSLDMDSPVRILEEFVIRGLALLRDHVEINQRFKEGSNGEDMQGELEVKVYPKGKTQSEEALRGNGAFEFSRPLGGLHFRFDFDFSPGLSDRRSEDYI